MNLRIPSNVRREIQEAAEYYEGERAGLGDHFWQEVDMHVRWIQANPTVPRLRGGDYRRVNLKVFPYYIACAIRHEAIVLLAVAHGHRKPHYWTET
ncbi:MAG: type II toxin-antitoxin system RelE/ParE family toxin [Chthoniobacter sp.]|uniref:type II toxin-antitoxin system RelE/ParE family toxin n=1 Tax=Chthoniobacter sp. TaxID=2510640 RepID=UPI0032A9B349